MEEMQIVYQGQHQSFESLSYIVFDIETTGLNATKDELIQISAVKIEKGEKIDSFNEYITPSQPLSDFIKKITNITDEDIMNSKSLPEVLQDFLDFVQDSVLIAHNITFEMKFLQEKLKNFHYLPLENTYIDSLELAHRIYPDRKRYGLVSLIRDFLNSEDYSGQGCLAGVNALCKLFPIMLNETLAKYNFKEIEQHQIVLTSGKSEITLKGKDSEQYPRIQEIAASNPLVLETKLLKKIINETAFAASVQESRPILTGVHFVLSNHQELKTVATDSHRLSQKKLTLEKNSDNFDVVIPSRSLREFSAVFTDDIETVEIFFANNQILFRSENISFYTRLLEGNYPDTDRLIPTDFNTTVTFDVVNLRQSMERARLLSSATQNGTVKLEIKQGIVTAHVNSPEVGKVNEEIDTESVSGEDLTISFNPTYLIEALKALNSEKVTISFISAVRPFTLVPADTDEDFMQLITPVRTN